MKNKHFFLLLTFISLTFTQNYNPNMWSGLSVTTSDNLDAINLNPAGLGIKRGFQFALNLQQSNTIDTLNSNVYVLTSAFRIPFGLALQNEYDEVNKYQWALGYGTRLYNNLYFGIAIRKNYYSTGLLYRPINALSLGLVHIHIKSNDEGKVDRNLRYGIAIRPFNFINKNKYNKNNFINYSNLTFGWDKWADYDNVWEEEKYQEFYFISFDIVSGMNLALQKFPGSYALNFTINIGTQGIQYTSYPSNPLYNTENTMTSSGITYFNYSQKNHTKLNDIRFSKNNYVSIDLNGYFIEEKPYNNFFDSFNVELPSLFGNNNLESIQLRTFVDNINYLAYKPNVDGLIIRLGDIKAGLAKRKEIFDAFLNFKNQNKEIIVYCDKNMISNNDYYLISMADKIFTNEHTGIDLKGINMEMVFLRGLLDTIYIVPEIVRVSPYKTAADIVLNEKMSDEMRENYGQLTNNLYETMVADIAKGKNWTIDETKTKIDEGPYYLNSKAVESNIINATMYEDEFNTYVNNRKINVIRWNDIIKKETYENDWVTNNLPKIAVIYAVGGIMSGESKPSSKGSKVMGDETITKAIIKAREDKSIKSIVLRIDSGGGSVLASDKIWREIKRTTDSKSENKKPVIVSMSDVAASGGYYIACNADTIMASPTTITGSIGVIWGRLNFTKLINRIGINIEGVQQGKNADFGSSSHLLTEEEKETIFNVINSEYENFKSKIVEGRDEINDINAMDEIANGRVWTGKNAKEKKLVDLEGGFLDAINVAKSVSGLHQNSDVRIVEYPKYKSFSFLNLFKKKDSIATIKFDDILPKDLSNRLEILNLVPVIMDNEVQLLMPYQIILN